MNRRRFLAGSAATLMLLPTIRADATDVDVAESPIMEMLRMLPDRPGPGGFDFPITYGANSVIQREVWPENPDMYWDPVGEDYNSLFGFHPSSTRVSAGQGNVGIWSMLPEFYTQDATQITLTGNGWELVDEETALLHYAGSDEDRDALADSLNQIGPSIRDGLWDWIALPDRSTFVPGSHEEHVRAIADRVVNFPPMTTVESNFHGLKYLLPLDAYALQLVPRQSLPVAGATAAFVSTSWIGDVPIVQSIGLRLEDAALAEPTLQTIQERMKTETSPFLDAPYADFLKIVDTKVEHASIRIDLVDTQPETVTHNNRWQVTRARDQDDLRMLPPL